MLVAVLFVLATFAAAEWWGDGEERALLALPASRRVELYQRSVDDMDALCGTPELSDPFAARCRDKATFLARFPECGRDCRTLIEPYLPKPTR
jgi:hypothetical protein